MYVHIWICIHNISNSRLFEQLPTQYLFPIISQRDAPQTEEMLAALAHAGLLCTKLWNVLCCLLLTCSLPETQLSRAHWKERPKWQCKKNHSIEQFMRSPGTFRSFLKIVKYIESPTGWSFRMVSTRPKISKDQLRSAQISSNHHTKSYHVFWSFQFFCHTNSVDQTVFFLAKKQHVWCRNHQSPASFWRRLQTPKTKWLPPWWSRGCRDRADANWCNSGPPNIVCIYIYIYVCIISYVPYIYIYIYMPHTTQNMPMTFKWLLIFLDRLLTRFPSAYIYMFKCAHCIWQTQVYIYTTPYTHIIYIYNYIIYYYRWTHRETYVTLFW